MKKLVKLIIKTICIIVVSSIVGTLLLVLSFSLPDASIQTNASKSSMQLVGVGDYPSVIDGFNGTMLDNYTDAIMINSASYIPNNYSLIERVLKVPQAHADWTSGPIADLYEYYNDEDAIIEAKSYERYWHGYITILRPLLMFCDYANIKFIYFALHFVLLFVFLSLLKKKTNIVVTFSFLISYICTYAFIVPLSLQYSHVFFIMLVSGIILLKYNDVLNKNHGIYFFFLIVGIITSYFDLLTYPLVTLGINLIIYILINKDIKIKDILIYISMWFIGYGGMWFMKWLISSIILGENVFLNAYNQIKQRTGGGYKILDVISGNLFYLKHSTTFIVFVSALISNIILKIKNRINKPAFNKQKFISIIIVIILPMIWYAILREHSSSHSVFTFRSLIISLFGILMLPECFETKYK